MKCPVCGTSNGKTNKFCRECGNRLISSIEDASSPSEIIVVEKSSALIDDVALGEELFQILQMYKANMLDDALARAEVCVRANPASVSAYSLLSLIYERKADYAKSAGYADTWRDLLRAAIGYQEQVIDLSPDSAADRQKLALLRLKLTGQQAKSKPAAAKMKISEILKKVPVPILAACATFILIIFFSSMFLIFSSARSRQDKPRLARPVESTPMNVPTAQAMPSAPPANTANTYQQPPAPAAAPAQQTAPNTIQDQAPPQIGISVSSQKPIAKVQPVIPNVSVVPQAKATPASNEIKPAQITSSPGSSGSGMLASATQHYGAGRYSEAVSSAQQAISLYQADVDAGRNVDSAKRGIANARRLIEVVQAQPGSQETSQQ